MNNLYTLILLVDSCLGFLDFHLSTTQIYTRIVKKDLRKAILCLNSHAAARTEK